MGSRWSSLLAFHGCAGPAILLAATLLCPVPAAHAQGGVTTRVSVDSSGLQGNGESAQCSISGDGRFVAFYSAATDLVPGDQNGWPDVFLHDRQTGQTTRVSVDSAGNEADQASSGPALAADGRCVAFYSSATNLAPGQLAGIFDVFVHDRQTGQTIRVSVDSAGLPGNGDSVEPTLSADGRYVAFSSIATNLVIGDTNGYQDVFVHDRHSGQTTRISVDSAGAEGNGASGFSGGLISSDARFVAFDSDATNLVPGDTNGRHDVFVHDRLTGETARASVDSSGLQGNEASIADAISAAGRCVVFHGFASNLLPADTNGASDVFVHDRQSGRTTRVSVDSAGLQGNTESYGGSISADGSLVSFRSYASNLVPGDTNGVSDVFERDRQSGQTTRISVDSSGLQGNGECFTSAVSADGRCIAFDCNATNLVPGDTNGVYDVFVRDLGPPSAPTTYCIAKTNSLGCTPSIGFTGFPSASAGSGFHISAAGVLNNRLGLMVYGKSGSTLLVFEGGFLCVQAPLSSARTQLSHGNPPPSDCSGSYSIDFNAFIATGADPELVAGQPVWSQYWSRDPGFAQPDDSGLSDALSFVILP